MRSDLTDWPLCVSGLRVSNATFNAIVMRYSNRHGEVRFADFVACVIKLKTLFGEIQTFSLLLSLACGLGLSEADPGF